MYETSRLRSNCGTLRSGSPYTFKITVYLLKLAPYIDEVDAIQRIGVLRRIYTGVDERREYSSIRYG